MDDIATPRNAPRATVYNLDDARQRGALRCKNRHLRRRRDVMSTFADSANDTGQLSDMPEDLDFGMDSSQCHYADTTAVADLARSADPADSYSRLLAPAPDPLLIVMLEDVKEIERLRAALTAIVFAAEAGRYPGEGLRKFVRQVARVGLRVDEDTWLDVALDDLRQRVEAARHEQVMLPLDVATPLGLLPVSTLEPAAPREHNRNSQPEQPKRRHRRLHEPRGEG